MTKCVPGINIQYPISRLILSGTKVVETRGYPIPHHLLGVDLALIETPGRNGDFEARVVGLIRFSGCFKYSDEQHFYSDGSRHCVGKESEWRWHPEKEKWGWVIDSCTEFETPRPAPKRKGIRYSKEVTI